MAKTKYVVTYYHDRANEQVAELVEAESPLEAWWRGFGFGSEDEIKDCLGGQELPEPHAILKVGDSEICWDVGDEELLYSGQVIKLG